MDYIQRTAESHIRENLFKGKIIVIYGARRVGKSTLSKEILKKYPDTSLYLNCELLQNKTLIETTNSELLKNLLGKHKLVVLDEAQTINQIGLTLKIIADTMPEIQVIATGSSSFNLSNQVSEPLTGRMKKYIIHPFSVSEIEQEKSTPEIYGSLENILRFGMYPDVVMQNEKDAIENLNEMVSSYLYKDILQFQNIRKPDLIINLLRALSLQIGSEVSTHELAVLLKQNSHTIENYISLLEQCFIIFRLPAFSRNLRKEISKSQKIYFYDLGIRNCLIQNFSPLELRNDHRNLWENFCVAERKKYLDNNRLFNNSYFWRTYDQQEIDYIEEHSGMLHAFEFKYKSAKKGKLPEIFKKTYPDSTFSSIHPENFRSNLLV